MTAEELQFVLRKTAAVFADPTRLDDLLAVCEILNRRTFRRLSEDFAGEAAGKGLLSDRPEITSAAVDLVALRALPPGTLGRAFATHLDTHRLDLDALAVPPRRDDERPDTYLLRRYRGNHDLWHTLLSLGVTVREEVLVNAFSWGQLGLPQNQIIVALGALRHLGTVRVAADAAKFLLEIGRHVRRGRRAAPLLLVRWEELWPRDLDTVRRELRLDAPA